MAAHDRIQPLPQRFVALVLSASLASCVSQPEIDGVPGAPATPSTPWTVPPSVATPPPAPVPPTARPVSDALHADSARIASQSNISMTDVIDIALRNNPATRESWATARVAGDQYGSALGAIYPTVNGSVNFTHTATSAASVSGTTVGGNDTTSNVRGTGGAGISRTQITPALSLSYLVFDLGGRAGTIEAAKQRAIASNLTHNATIQDVVLQAEASVFGYLAARALRDAQVIAVQEAQADTAAAEARMRLGVATLEEVLQTRTALAQAKLQLATLRGDLLNARAALASAMGIPANARFEVPDITASDSVRAIAASVDTLINRAITLRPELAQVRAEASALASEIRVAQSARYPSLTLSSTTTFPQQIQGTGTSVTGRNLSVVLGLQVPLFNGLAREYDLRAARDAHEAGLARVEAMRLQIGVQVFTSYAALQTATDRVQASVELLTAARQSSEVAVGRYREGVGTIVDVLLARSALATARAAEVQARWQWRIALAQLAHDVGALDTRGRPNIPLRP